MALYQVALPARLLGGITAFTPNMTRMAASGAQMYKHAVSGQPGTQAISAPTSNTQMSPDLGDLAQTGYHRSGDAPQVWYPSQYYERSLDGDGTMGPIVPARVFSDDIMPVPARDPRGLPAMLAFTPHFLGQQQIIQPRNMPQWGTNA